MRRAVPQPCWGPMASRVFKTIKSRVPWRMSDLSAGIRPPVVCTQEYRKRHVGCQQEKWRMRGAVTGRGDDGTRTNGGSDENLRRAKGIGGVDAHRAASGQIACQHCYYGEQSSTCGKDDWVGCAGLK